MVLVCEDKQHHVFVRRFLKQMRWSVNQLRIESAPTGRGAADHFVKARHVKELKALRQGVALLTMLDGDAQGLNHRLRELDAVRGETGLSPPDHNQVFVFVPTWKIETWLRYLDGHDVDETNPNYPRLDCERECRKHVRRLAEMCRKRQLREPAPPSLEAACEEFRRFESANKRES